MYTPCVASEWLLCEISLNILQVGVSSKCLSWELVWCDGIHGYHCWPVSKEAVSMVTTDSGSRCSENNTKNNVSKKKHLQIYISTM